MIKNVIIAELGLEAVKYNDNEYKRFEDEIGWQKWMNEYTDAKDGEECTEAEINEINKILKQAWDNVHKQ